MTIRKGTLRIYQHFRTLLHSWKSSKVLASFGVCALVGVIFIGSGQFQHALTNAALSRSASTTITCPVCDSVTLTGNITIHNQPHAWHAPHQAPPTSVKQPQQVTRSTRTVVRSVQPPVQITPVTPTQQQTGPGFNPFPNGQCTWWADQRYYQLHGIYVPWHNQADAWQWTARAYQYGWHVSSTPVVGAIMNLQPGVQGAGPYGHVGVVEKILPNGHVIASSLNWGAYYWQVVDVEFTPGPGVTFLYA